jgi:hypothetical protein
MLILYLAPDPEDQDMTTQQWQDWRHVARLGSQGQGLPTIEREGHPLELGLEVA